MNNEKICGECWKTNNILTDGLCDKCYGHQYQLDAEADERTDEDVE